MSEVTSGSREVEISGDGGVEKLVASGDVVKTGSMRARQWLEGVNANESDEITLPADYKESGERDKDLAVLKSAIPFAERQDTEKFRGDLIQASQRLLTYTTGAISGPWTARFIEIELLDNQIEKIETANQGTPVEVSAASSALRQHRRILLQKICSDVIEESEELPRGQATLSIATLPNDYETSDMRNNDVRLLKDDRALGIKLEKDKPGEREEILTAIQRLLLSRDGTIGEDFVRKLQVIHQQTMAIDSLRKSTAGVPAQRFSRIKELCAERQELIEFLATDAVTAKPAPTV